MLLAALACAVAGGESSGIRVDGMFHVVVFTCIFGREQLTDFVLGYYADLAQSLAADDHIQLNLFITGSDAASTASLASRYGAHFAVFPNSPLGAKHNGGILALRDHFLSTNHPLPHGVVIIGSDDLLNHRFFTMTRDRMSDASRAAPLQLLGVRDLYLYDLSAAASGGRLAYTKGYRSFSDALAATVGCGRVFTWALLERMDWQLWDGERERSLDQSTVRRVRAALGAELENVAEAVVGRDVGVVAVDVKTGGIEGGTNIWSYNDIVTAVGPKGKLHRFREVESKPFFDEYFGENFEETTLQPLLARMRSLGKKDSEGNSSDYLDGFSLRTVNAQGGECAST